jgi:hypothetical protein
MYGAGGEHRQAALAGPMVASFTVLRSFGLLRSIKARHTQALQALQALARSVLSRELRRKGPVLRARAISDT